LKTADVLKQTNKVSKRGMIFVSRHVHCKPILYLLIGY